jgi:hypothetical protein
VCCIDSIPCCTKIGGGSHRYRLRSHRQGGHPTAARPASVPGRCRFSASRYPTWIATARLVFKTRSSCAATGNRGTAAAVVSSDPTNVSERSRAGYNLRSGASAVRAFALAPGRLSSPGDSRRDCQVRHVLRSQPEDGRIFVWVRIRLRLSRTPSIHAGGTAEDGPSPSNGGCAVQRNRRRPTAGTSSRSGALRRVAHFCRTFIRARSFVRQASVPCGVSSSMPKSPRLSGATGVVASMIILCEIPLG